MTLLLSLFSCYSLIEQSVSTELEKNPTESFWNSLLEHLPEIPFPVHLPSSTFESQKGKPGEEQGHQNAHHQDDTTAGVHYPQGGGQCQNLNKPLKKTTLSIFAGTDESWSEEKNDKN